MKLPRECHPSQWTKRIFQLDCYSFPLGNMDAEGTFGKYS
jgi:hypothetical protein